MSFFWQLLKTRNFDFINPFLNNGLAMKWINYVSGRRVHGLYLCQHDVKFSNAYEKEIYRTQI